VLHDRVAVVEAALDALLADPPPGTGPRGARSSARSRLVPTSDLTVAQALELFTDQVTSRALDVAARRLKAEGTPTTRSRARVTRTTPCSAPGCARPTRASCTTARAG
jgi:hypothetical protein